MTSNTTATLMKSVNTIVIGGGHAGVNLGCWLEKEKSDHDYLILEKSDTLLSQWKYARWENFQMNTPVRFSTLYGEDVGDDEKLDRPLPEDIDRWNAHIEKMKIKYQLHAKVETVEKNEDEDFKTTVWIHNPDGSKEKVIYVSKNVVCANGCYNSPNKVVDEDLAKSHPEIKQHTPMGLKMSDLIPGGILIVGGGQTGVQLADLFADSKQHSPIALCTSKINGTPRAYRGRDIFYWMEQCKFLFIPKEALKEMPPPKAESLRYGHNPITGATKPISPLSLHRKGVELLGGFDKVNTVDCNVNNLQDCLISIKPNRAENVKTSIDGVQMILDMICHETAKNKENIGQNLTSYEPEEEWEIQSDKEEQLTKDNGPLFYNLSKKGVTNVVWATGFRANFDFLSTIPEAQEDFDKRTNLPDSIQCENIPGLFFTGFPWVGNCQSTNIVNFDQDHKVIVENLKGW